jgi:hypothetical protein
MEYTTKLSLNRGQFNGHTYIRINPVLRVKEYLSYAGGNGCTWYDDPRYYNRTPGATFGPEF